MRRVGGRGRQLAGREGGRAVGKEPVSRALEARSRAPRRACTVDGCARESGPFAGQGARDAERVPRERGANGTARRGTETEIERRRARETADRSVRARGTLTFTR